MTNAAQEDIYW